MPFETPRPEEQNEKFTKASEKLSEIINDLPDVELLERAIRFMTPDKRQKLYDAVEISKIATDDLILK